jgi:nitroreductase
MATTTSEKPLSEVIRHRRSTPSFAPDPVTEEDLQKILDAGLLAPSGYNTQPWRFIVVRDQGQKEKLAAAAMNQRRIAEAPVVIVACGDSAHLDGDILDEMLRLAKEHGYGDERQHELVRKNFPNFIESLELTVWLNRQVAIALTQMMLMAEVLGYDTSIMEGFWEDQVKELLQAPSTAHVVALLCIGKLRGPDKPFGGRFDRRRTVFYERWTAR